MLGTLHLAILLIISFNESNLVSCLVIEAFIGGLCGCLTTLSSIVAEIMELTIKDAVFYVAVTFVSGLLLLFLGVGIPILLNKFEYASGCFIL